MPKTYRWDIKCGLLSKMEPDWHYALRCSPDPSNTKLASVLSSGAPTNSPPTPKKAEKPATVRRRLKYVDTKQELPPEPEFDDTMAEELDPQAQATSVEPLPEGPLNEFIWTPSPTVHSIRRRAILAAHPELEDLYGADPQQAVTLLLTVVLQFGMAYVVQQLRLSWVPFIIVCFTVSATLNHSLFAALHEASHRTIISSKFGSELLSIIATLPMGLPAAIPFKRYHLDHHIYMGVEKLDPDLPTRWEGAFFRTTFGKLLWVTCLPITYSLRPLLTRPKPILPIDVLAWIMNGTADLLVIRYIGFTGLLYFLIGNALSMNFHPFAGHFISEHFIFPGVRDVYQETASYYGPYNWLTYNVGYHNEHHDFPRIPGSKLPLVRKLAPEFYKMPEEPDWGAVVWKFIFTKNVTPFNRVLRVGLNGGTVPKGLPAKHVFHAGKYPPADAFWPRIESLTS